MDTEQFEAEFDKISKWFLDNNKPIDFKKFQEIASPSFSKFFITLDEETQKNAFIASLKRVKGDKQ